MDQVPLYGIPQARILEWIAISFSRQHGISVYNLFESLFCVSYCVSSPPFTNLFIHKSVWYHRYFILLSYSATWLNFVVEIVSVQVISSSYSWLLCPLDILPSLCFGFFVFTLVFLGTFLLSGALRGCRLTSCVSCFSHKISHFFQETWFLSLESGIRSQDVDTQYVCCYWGIISFSPHNWESKTYMCVLTYVCPCTYKIFHVWPSLCKLNMDLYLMSPAVVHYHMDHSNLFSLILWERECFYYLEAPAKVFSHLIGFVWFKCLQCGWGNGKE